MTVSRKAQRMRVYLDYEGDPRQAQPLQFFGKTPVCNTEPAWPGTHYVDFELTQFFEIPVLKKEIREKIEADPKFVAASMQVVGGVMTNVPARNGCSTYGDVGITVDCRMGDNGCVYTIVTIWAPSISGAIEGFRKRSQW